jgi:hypothetical protein
MELSRQERTAEGIFWVIDALLSAVRERALAHERRHVILTDPSFIHRAFLEVGGSLQSRTR